MADPTTTLASRHGALDPSFVPTPTREYRLHQARLRSRADVAAKPVALPRPTLPPLPVFVGARALVWKQDPSVAEIGVRKVYLPGFITTGPRDQRIAVQGLPPVTHNALGDYIESPGTPAFDAVHAFAVVRETLTLFERLLGAPIPWQWNTGTNVEPIGVFPHAGVTQNAYYSRGDKALKFFFFDPPGTTPGTRTTFTCRSLDIVAHETGHAILDALKPKWLLASNPPQTGGLHESFGDLTAIFLALSQLDQVEAVIAQTKGNLHDKTFLSDLAEEFGNALGRPNGLRNADNDLKLSEVGNDVHAISQVFTGAIYDILADTFAFERKPARRDDAVVLYEVGQYLLRLVLRAIIDAPPQAAKFADIANEMLHLAEADDKPVEYRNFIRNRFAVREVVLSPTPLTEDVAPGFEMAPAVVDDPGAPQDRSRCCGTMQLGEFYLGPEVAGAETDELRRAMATLEKEGPAALLALGAKLRRDPTRVQKKR